MKKQWILPKIVAYRVAGMAYEAGIPDDSIPKLIDIAEWACHAGWNGIKLDIPKDSCQEEHIKAANDIAGQAYAFGKNWKRMGFALVPKEYDLPLEAWRQAPQA